MSTELWPVHYAYGIGAADTYEADCLAGVDELCPTTKQQIVTGPDGVWERYEYGIMYGLNEGQLLKKETGTGPGNILQTETYSYVSESVVSSQSFPNAVGTDPRSFSDTFSSSKLRPLVVKTIRQQGIDFVWRVDLCGTAFCFDAFARPVRIVRSSAPSP